MIHGIKWSGMDVTTAPVIGTILIRSIGPFAETTRKVVEIAEDGVIYVLNTWYKPGVPHIIHKDLVIEFKPINQEQ